MNNIDIYKQDLIENGQKVGLMTIIRGLFPKNVPEENIKHIMRGVVDNYVENRPHNTFVLEDSSCAYVIIEDMNGLSFTKYKQ